MSPAPDLTDPQLTELVVRTLADKARDAAVPTEPFDPARRTSFSDVDAGGPDALAPAGPTRPRVRWMAPLAAAAVAVVAVAVGAVVASDDDRPATRTERNPVAQEPTNTPDGALLPGWLPEGLVPWTGSWGAALPVPTPTAQLFQGGGGAGVLIEIHTDMSSTLQGDPVTVRGLPGTVSGPFKPDEGTPLMAFLNWQEDGASVQVVTAEMELPEALAFLDGLSWRGPDRAEGFDPDSADLPLVDEAGGGAGPRLSAAFTFADPAGPQPAADQGRYLVIETASAGGRADHSYYLNRLMNPDEEDEATRDVNGEVGYARLSWRDGREVTVRSRGIAENDLRRVEDSVAPAPGQDLDTLVAAVSDRLAALPLAAQATLPSGTVELHDGGGLDRGLCLRVPGHGPACEGLGFDPDLSFEDNGLTSASVTVGGTWYVVAAAPKPAVVTPEDIFNPGTVDLSNETATDGTWTFALARPPAELQNVGVQLDGNLAHYQRRPMSAFPDA